MNGGGPLRQNLTDQVAETVLRRRAERRRATSARAARNPKSQKAPKFTRKNEVITLEKLVKQARNKIIDKRRVNNFSKLTAPKVSKNTGSALIIAIRNDKQGVAQATANILKTLNLVDRFTGVLLHNTSEVLQTLRQANSFVFYGYPTLETLRNLFYKRAVVKSNGDEQQETKLEAEQRVQEDDDEKRKEATSEGVLLTDNVMIEDRWGPLGLLCIEDLIAELWSGGKHADTILAELMPFRLGDLRQVDGLNAQVIKGNQRFKVNGFLAKIT